jgi:hypothetical protein
MALLQASAASRPARSAGLSARISADRQPRKCSTFENVGAFIGDAVWNLLSTKGVGASQSNPNSAVTLRSKHMVVFLGTIRQGI